MRSMFRSILLAALVGLLALATGAFAETESPPADQPPASERGDRCGRAMHKAPRLGRGLVHSESKFETEDGFATRTIDRGTVTAVDHDDLTLTVERADGVGITVKASENTKVCRSGQGAEFSALEVGDTASILQTTKGSETTVRGILARPAGDAESEHPNSFEPRKRLRRAPQKSSDAGPGIEPSALPSV